MMTQKRGSDHRTARFSPPWARDSGASVRISNGIESSGPGARTLFFNDPTQGENADREMELPPTDRVGAGSARRPR
jgi:hypothetical protein